MMLNGIGACPKLRLYVRPEPPEIAGKCTQTQALPSLGILSIS